MKRLILPLLLLAILSITPNSINAQTAHRSATSTNQTYATQFIIVFLGTRHYSDINPILTSLRGLPYISKLTPSLESQSRLEFVGFFTGSKRSFNADIASLTANRFIMNESSDENHTLIITLKKITTPKTKSSF